MNTNCIIGIVIVLWFIGVFFAWALCYVGARADQWTEKALQGRKS